MEGKGPRFERETVITFNEEEAEAAIWTASETIYRRLIKRLGRTYLAEDGERHAVFKFPKEFISLPRLKAQKSLTRVSAGIPRHSRPGNPNRQYAHLAYGELRWLL